MNEGPPKADKNSQDDFKIEMNKIGLEIEQLQLEFRAKAEAGTVTPADRESFQYKLALLYGQYLTLSKFR